MPVRWLGSPLPVSRRLEPLTRNGTARWLGKAWLPGTVDEFAEEIHYESNGNPFLVDALAIALVTRGGGLYETDVHELAPRQRAALVLTELIGFSSEEAGRMLGVRPGTVRALASQGRTAMKQHLEADDV